MSNYVLQIQLEGADKAEASLDSILKKIGKLNSGNVDFSMDKAIDASGFLKSGEWMGEELSKGIKKGVKKNLSGNWVGLLGEWGAAVEKGTKDNLEPKLVNKRRSEDIKNNKELSQMYYPDFLKKFKAPEKFNKSAFMRELAVGGIATLFNPFVGSGMLAGSIGKHKGGKDGTLGALSTLSYGETFVIVKSLESVVKAFSAAVRVFFDSAKKADQYYSNALQNGLGTSFSIRRGTLAQIMGVSENDVLRFGTQMAYLNPKIENAVKILSKTNAPMTKVSWDFKTLKLDIEALASDISTQLAPAMDLWINGIDRIVKSLTNPKFIWLVDFLGRMSVNNKGTLGFMDAGLKATLDSIAISSGKFAGDMPSPNSWMKQLPASHWEKMGLMTMGGGQNYAKDTAKNTKEIAVAIKAMAARNSGKPQNSYWGTSPLTANP